MAINYGVGIRVFECVPNTDWAVISYASFSINF